MLSDSLKKYKLIIAYDGTHYSGWQIQPHAVSIQEKIQDSLSTFLRSPIQLIGSGRTDAGVHALGQVAHFTFSESIDPYRFLYAANALLPADIRLLSIEEVPLDFQAQYSVQSKIYHYHLWLEPIQSPFHRLYSYHYREKVDLKKLQEAAGCFVGKKDFTSFANIRAGGEELHNAVRTLIRLDVIPQTGGIRLEFQADGFLYKMVRNIVGMVLDVARGYTPLEKIPTIFAARDRRAAGAAAPPHGLFLAEVIYPTLLKNGAP